MGIHSPIAGVNPQRLNQALGHQWRSELLNCFAGLEAVTVAKCHELVLNVSNKATLAQRLAAIRKAELCAADVSRARIDECLALVDVRNDLVHAKLHLVMLPADEGGPTCLFRNVAQFTNDGTAQCRMVNEAGFKSLQLRVKKARDYIRQLKTPTPAAAASPSDPA